MSRSVDSSRSADTLRTAAHSRRSVLRAIGAAAVLGTIPDPTVAAPVPTDDLEAWFADVDNYDGVVDATGQSTVHVSVGAPGNGGAFAFSPAAVRVDPGTTVVWEWTGEGGVHDVAAADGSFGSPMTDDAGATFEHAFATDGVARYACTPHETLGMKGAVVVGDALAGGPGADAVEPDYGDWFDDVPNFAGTVDATGRDEVRIAVGSTADGRPVFEPAAVRVDPGTTVVWVLDDASGTHTVTAADGSYDSGPLSESGGAYALAFDGNGVSRYRCAEHAGMRGAVVVGDGGTPVSSFTPLAVVVGGGLGAGLLAFLGYGLSLHVREVTGRRPRPDAAPPTPIADPAGEPATSPQRS